MPAAPADGSSAVRSEALAAVLALERCTPPQSAPTASPLLDGRWSLLWTCSASDAATASRDGDAFGLQAASDAAYQFFYKRLPFIAGAAPAGSALGPARAGTRLYVHRHLGAVMYAARQLCVIWTYSGAHILARQKRSLTVSLS